MITKVWLYIALGVQVGVSIVIRDSIESIISTIFGILFILGIGRGYKYSYILGMISAIASIIVNLRLGVYVTVLYLIVCALPIQSIGLYKVLKGGDSTHEVRSLSKRGKYYTILCVIGIILVVVTLFQTLDSNYVILSALGLCFGLFGNYFTMCNNREQWLFWVLQNISNVMLWVQIIISTGDGYGQLTSMVIFLINALVGMYEYKKRL